MRKLRLPIFFMLLPVEVHAQFIGYTSPQTVQQTVFTNQSTATTFNVANLGQSVHLLSYVTNGPCTSLQLRLEGSNNGTVFFALTNDALDSASNPVSGTSFSGSIAAIGYYPVIRANLVAISGCTISASYSGSTSMPPPSGPLLQVASPDRLLIANNLVTSAAFSTITLPTPYGNSYGSIWLQCSAACAAGGVINVLAAPSDSGLGSTNIGTFTVATVATLQRFDINGNAALNTSRIFISITPTAASANTWTIVYNFSRVPNSQVSGSASQLAGQSANGAVLTVLPGNFSAINNPAAGAQASASVAAGGTTVRHVANCITFSSGSTTAPALTALTVNLRDGASGAGSIIWTHEVVISASTGQNTPPVEVCGLNIVGSPNTAMTLEFSAGLANLIEAVSFSGYNAN